MADLDERSGIVACPTVWGLWYQTLDEVSLEISLASHVKAKNVSVNTTPIAIKVEIEGNTLFEGKLYANIMAGNTIWTLESDKHQRLLRVVLQKREKTIHNIWPALLEDAYFAEDWLYENMKKKAAIEKLQLENPGFDLSGADCTGDYATGGPDVPS